MLVDRGASVLELGGGSTTDERKGRMAEKRPLSSVVLLVVPVSTEVKGTGVGVGVLDSCGSDDDACSDVADPLRSGMSGMSGSDMELLEVGVKIARSGAL